MRYPRVLVILTGLFILLFVITSGCAGNSAQETSSQMNMASMADMPDEVQAAPQSVQESYRFAAANAELLSQIPCYCGCGAMGHTSNYSCYVSGENEDGSLSFDAHALGCSICVDITQDTMRLVRDGKSVAEIRSYIDQTYSPFGPSNMP